MEMDRRTDAHAFLPCRRMAGSSRWESIHYRPQRAMTAIDIETGNTVWRTFQSMVRETIGLSEDKERIYSKTMNDSIVCYSTKGDQPHKLWASNVGFGYEHAPSMQVEKNGVVFGSTKEGLIFALEAATGKVLWKHKQAIRS